MKIIVLISTIVGAFLTECCVKNCLFDRFKNWVFCKILQCVRSTPSIRCRRVRGVGSRLRLFGEILKSVHNTSVIWCRRKLDPIRDCWCSGLTVCLIPDCFFIRLFCVYTARLLCNCIRCNDSVLGSFCSLYFFYAKRSGKSVLYQNLLRAPQLTKFTSLTKLLTKFKQVDIYFIK